MVTRHEDAYPVEVRAVTDPAGRRGVLLQMPDGFVIMRPAAARGLGILLIETSIEIDHGVADGDTP